MFLLLPFFFPYFLIEYIYPSASKTDPRSELILLLLEILILAEVEVQGHTPPEIYETLKVSNIMKIKFDETDQNTLSKTMVVKLSRGASLFGENFPNKMKTGNKETNAGVRQNLLEIETAFRQMRVDWLLTGNNSEFKQRIADYLGFAIRREWNRFSHATRKEVSTLKMASFFKRVINTHLMVGIPTLIYLGLQTTPYAFTDPIDGNIHFILFIWACINLIYIADPSVFERIAALRDSLSFFNIKI